MVENVTGLEMDHVFVCAPTGEQDAAVLTEFGLQLGATHVHSGQGTANACFFFDNAYLELLWLHDQEEIRSPTVRPTALWERVRWREAGACPFGVSYRPRDGVSNIGTLRTWNYEAPFLPAGASIPVVTPPYASTEPLVFISLFSCRPADYAPERRVPLMHLGRRHELTRVRVEMPRGHSLSKEPAKCTEVGPVAIAAGARYHMELELDGGVDEKTADFEPALPLSLRW